jgi:hypothetical protein
VVGLARRPGSLGWQLAGGVAARLSVGSGIARVGLLAGLLASLGLSPVATGWGSRGGRAQGGWHLGALALAALTAASVGGAGKRYGRRRLLNGRWGAGNLVRGHPQWWRRVVHPQ